MNSAGATTVVKSVGEARPREFMMCSDMSGSESELAECSDEESSDETGPLWSREQVACPAQPQQQHSQSLLVKIDLLGSQKCSATCACSSSWRRGTAFKPRDGVARGSSIT